MTAKQEWIVLDRGHWVHILPSYDIAYHTLNAYCPCRPELSQYHEGEKRMLTHNAFDAREFDSVVDCAEPIPFDLPLAYDATHFSSLQH